MRLAYFLLFLAFLSLLNSSTSLQDLTLPALFQKAWDADENADALTDAQIEVQQPFVEIPLAVADHCQINLRPQIFPDLPESYRRNA